MRLSALLSVAFILILSVNAQQVSKTDSEKTPPRNNQPTPENPSTRIEINVGNPPYTQPAQPQGQHAIAPAQPAPISNGEWLIAGITGVYALSSILTYFMIRRQAKIAKSGTDAVIAIERAWITVTIDWSPAHEGIFDMKGASFGESRPVNWNAMIRMTYKNEGKTPAWIFERRASLKIFESGTRPEKPPLKDAAIIHHEIVSLAAGEEKSCDTPLSCEGIRTWDNLIVIYGVVGYRTVIPKILGESVFGYGVLMDGKTRKPLEAPEWNTNA